MGKLNRSTALLALCVACGAALAQRSSPPARVESGQSRVVGEREGIGAGPAAKLSKESYVKIRVEVEIRGTLCRTEKGLAVAAFYAGPVDDSNDLPRVHGGKSYFELDFSRAEKLRERSISLHGKEVIVTGMGELREEAPIPGSGSGFGSRPSGPAPGWNLRHAIIVTDIRTVEEK